MAASEILEEGGPGTLSLRDVARRAGVSHTAPYRHFRSRADLLYALAGLGFQELDRATREAGHVDADAREQLIGAGVAYVRLAVRHRERTQLMFGGMLPPQEAPPEVVTIAQASLDALFEMIERGKQQGVFLNRDTRELALSAWALVHGAAMLIVGGQCPIDLNSDQELEAFVLPLIESLLNGIQNPKGDAA